MALAVLLNAHLLEEVDRERYRFHDLLREFARQWADETDTVAVRNAAICRLVAWFGAKTDHADHQVAARGPACIPISGRTAPDSRTTKTP